METHRIVVDGSNVATEGRSTPSLAQLDDAVRQLQQEMPGYEVIVVVDATFGHRIDPAEKAAFDEAEAHGELVSPPAGTIGRGDAFLLQVALRADALVFSNDSFQEFHGEHDWLFEPGRLIGGKPVPGIGWIFTPRTPVRGPRSRAAVAAAKGGRPTARAKSATTGRASRTRSSVSRPATALLPPDGDGRRPAIGDTRPAPPPRPPRATAPSAEPEPAAPRRRRRRSGDASSELAVEPAPASAPTPLRRTAVGQLSDQVTSEATSGTRRRRRSAVTSATPVNEPLPFLRFVTEHPLGSTVSGVVDTYVSHGAMVLVDDMRCYVPLANLRRPAPTRAREIVARGERYDFVLVALDPARRGAELAVPELASTILRSNAAAAPPADDAVPPRRRTRATAKTTELPGPEPGAPLHAVAAPGVTKTAAARTPGTATKRAAATKQGAATRTPATAKKSAAAATKKGAATRTPAAATTKPPAGIRPTALKTTRAVKDPGMAVPAKRRALGAKRPVTQDDAAAKRAASTKKAVGTLAPVAATKKAAVTKKASSPVQSAAAKQAASTKRAAGAPAPAAAAKRAAPTKKVEPPLRAAATKKAVGTRKSAGSTNTSLDVLAPGAAAKKAGATKKASSTKQAGAVKKAGATKKVETPAQAAATRKLQSPPQAAVAKRAAATKKAVGTRKSAGSTNTSLDVLAPGAAAKKAGATKKASSTKQAGAVRKAGAIRKGTSNS